MPIWTLLSLLEWSFFLRAFHLSLFFALFCKCFFTVDGNLNGKFFYTSPFWCLILRLRIHRQKIYFYCLLSVHTTFPSPPTISQLIILYDWKIFLLDTIDGTLETDSESTMDDVAWCLWHSRVNCRLNFKLGGDGGSVKGEGNGNGDCELYAKC